MSRRTLSFVAAALLAAALPAGAQPTARAADSLLRVGQVFRAESIYYLAVRREPKNPEARLALGRYLAARGALKVGAVLMEEARFFGGDPATVARDLAPIYARIGDYRALATLPGSPLSGAETARAEWLRAAPPSHLGPDLVELPLVADEGLGRVSIAIGADTLEAIIDPTARGLVLDTAWRRRPGIKTFGASRPTVAVVPSMRMGALTLTNVSTTLAPMPRARRARIGLDLLAQFTPTFEPAAGRLTLRRAGEVDARAAVRIPTLVLPSGVWLVQPQGVVPLSTSAATLGQRAWTLRARRGDVLVERND